MALKSPRFAGNARLQQAALNQPPMCVGEQGQPVRIIQQALLDLGYSLPISTKRFGSPDGIFGRETRDRIIAFQKKAGLVGDGVVGTKTMAEFDRLLPGLAVPIAPLPPALPVRIKGMIAPIKQPNTMACWATAYTIMLSWQRQQSISILDAITPLGQKWVDAYTKNTGTAVTDNRPFARATGLIAEPPMSFSIRGWADMLRDRGPLWFSFGWSVAGPNGLPNRTGRHLIVITGMSGDETNEGTTVDYIDPSDGMAHQMTFGAFLSEYELGFTLTPLSDDDLKGFSQVLHY